MRIPSFTPVILSPSGEGARDRNGLPTLPTHCRLRRVLPPMDSSRVNPTLSLLTASEVRDALWLIDVFRALEHVPARGRRVAETDRGACVRP